MGPRVHRTSATRIMAEGAAATGANAVGVGAIKIEVQEVEMNPTLVAGTGESTGAGVGAATTRIPITGEGAAAETTPDPLETHSPTRSAKRETQTITLLRCESTDNTALHCTD